jgi:hypothetical protein
MKGKKEINDMIENSGFKDMLMSHENVLRSYIMEKSVLPKLKRDSQAVVNIKPRNSVFRLDTVTALNNLIHEKSFMDDIKKGGYKSEGRNNLPSSIDISNNRKVTFNDDSSAGIRSARPLSDNNLSANEGIINYKVVTLVANVLQKPINSIIEILKSILLSKDGKNGKERKKNRAGTNLKMESLVNDFKNFSKEFRKSKINLKKFKKKNKLADVPKIYFRQDSNISEDSNDPKRRQNVIKSGDGINLPNMSSFNNTLPAFNQAIHEEDFHSDDDLSNSSGGSKN